MSVIGGNRVYQTVARSPHDADTISFSKPTSEEAQNIRLNFGSSFLPRKTAYVSARRGLLDSAVLAKTLPDVLTRERMSDPSKMVEFPKSTRRRVYKSAYSRSAGRIRNLQRFREPTRLLDPLLDRRLSSASN